MADELDNLVRQMSLPKVIIVATEETRAEFEEALGKEAQDAVVGWTSAEAHAQPTELLELTSPILEEAGVKDEAELIERWREHAGRGERAASGWEETLEAASDERVETLLYQDGAEHEAAQCPACGRLSVAAGPCPLDGTQMERRDEGLDLVVRQVIAHSGTAHAVAAHQDLQPVGGIGALLRY